MNTLSTSSTSLFREMPANLKVQTESKFDDFEAMILTKMWKFQNCEEQTKSLINRVEVSESRHDKIIRVDIFFNVLNSKTKEFLLKSMKSTPLYFQYDNQCVLHVRNENDMKSLLNMIDDTQKFDSISKFEMKKILAKL